MYQSAIILERALLPPEEPIESTGAGVGGGGGGGMVGAASSSRRRVMEDLGGGHRRLVRSSLTLTEIVCLVVAPALVAEWGVAAVMEQVKRSISLSTL